MRNFLEQLNRATIDYPRTIEAYAATAKVADCALQIVPFLYFFLLYKAFSMFVTWQQTPLFAAEQFVPRWNVAWLSAFPFDTAILVATSVFLAGMFVASISYARWWARAIAFLSLFFFHGFMSSFGAPEHNLLVWVYPLLFLIFMPDVWHRDTTPLERKKVLITFLGAQIYIGVIYSMAGLSKLWRGIEQLIAGQANVFSPDAFALHIADWLPTIGSPSLLGPTIVEHPLLGWPLFLGMLYFQLFTIYAVFRPKLHLLWGAFLLLFYIFNFLTMNIIYIDSFFLIAALMLYSPFAREASFQERVREMPLIGFALRYVGARTAR
jgi:hypothetical protein